MQKKCRGVCADWPQDSDSDSSVKEVKKKKKDTEPTHASLQGAGHALQDKKKKDKKALLA